MRSEAWLFVLFVIGVNTRSVIKKFFREPVSAQFDQLNQLSLNMSFLSQEGLRNVSGSSNNNKVLLEQISQNSIKGPRSC